VGEEEEEGGILGTAEEPKVVWLGRGHHSFALWEAKLALV